MLWSEKSAHRTVTNNDSLNGSQEIAQLSKHFEAIHESRNTEASHRVLIHGEVPLGRSRQYMQSESHESRYLLCKNQAA
jgi:hypothetical protein